MKVLTKILTNDLIADKEDLCVKFITNNYNIENGFYNDCVLKVDKTNIDLKNIKKFIGCIDCVIFDEDFGLGDNNIDIEKFKKELEETECSHNNTYL